MASQESSKQPAAIGRYKKPMIQDRGTVEIMTREVDPPGRSEEKDNVVWGN